MIKRLLPIALFPIFSVYTLFAQIPGYWQQHVDYRMNVDLDTRSHLLTGDQTLVYTNNSPDTLYKVYYHLYYNAFQPGSAMDWKSLSVPDPFENRISRTISSLRPSEQGYSHVKSMTQDGTAITFHTEGTILEVSLAQPLLPGKNTSLHMTWQSQVPLLKVRTGRNSHEGVEYTMTQWYPKMCEYDRDGWHADPYIGREFYGVFGNFDVTISIDARYTLGGTGVVTNPGEVGKGYQDEGIKVKNKGKIRWHFTASRVHDFAWAASRKYILEKYPVNDTLVLHSLRLKKSDAKRWNNVMEKMVLIFRRMESFVGTYPYPQFSFIQGGDGGMEYPMCTMITDDGSEYDLLSVSVHEAIHNWFYGVLGNDEGNYPFMDEGLTTWASFYMEDFLAGANQDNPAQMAYFIYYMLASRPHREPLSTHSDFYHYASNYEYSAYYTGVVFVDQLRYIVGQESFFKGLKEYFATWQFKHPRPEDFIRCMEKASGLTLDWYLERFVYSLSTIEYGIKSLKNNDGLLQVELFRKGNFPMPVDVVITMKDGTQYAYTIPLDIMRGSKSSDSKLAPSYTVAPDWMWVAPEYTLQTNIRFDEVASVNIDPSDRMADLVKTNNYSTK